jgi:formyl-CoA transferase
MHTTVNRNKRSVTLDLRRPEGRDLFLALAARADVVVENFRPGTLDAWGCGYTAVRALKPDVVFASISGFGQYGRDHDRAGYDPLAQAASGFLSLNGSPDGEPVKAPTFLGDDLAGLHGALAAMMALHHRDRTGEGQHIDSSLLDSVLFQSNGYLTLAAMGEPTPRMGSEVTVNVPVNVFACQDGHIYLAIALDTHWSTLCGIMGRPDLARAPGFTTNADRVNNRDAVNAVVAEWCRVRPVAEVERRIGGAGIAVAVVETFSDAARNPHVL